MIPNSRIHAWQITRLRYNLCPSNRKKKKVDGQKIQIMCLCRMEITLWRVHKEKHNGKLWDSHGDELKTRLLVVAIPGGKDVSKAVKDWKVKNDNVH
jgi:hypothetical protein